MTDNVTLQFGGPSSSEGGDAEHVWIVQQDGSRKTVSPSAVLRCKVLRDLVALHGNATLPFRPPEVEAWQALKTPAVPQSITALCSALRVAAFLQDDLTATCTRSISKQLADRCLEIAQDPTEAQKDGAFSNLMDNLLTLDEELLTSILKSVNLKLFLPNAPQKLVYIALRAAMVSSQDMTLDCILSCIPFAHTEVLSCLVNFRMLSRLSLTSNHLTDESFGVLVTNLSSMTGLQHLNISDNHLTHHSTAGLGDALSSLQFFQHLDISSNSIADIGACALSCHLPAFPSLSYFNVKYNSITSTGFTALSSALQPLTSLRCLDISENSVCLLSETSVSLEEHLQKASLKHLEMSGCTDGPGGGVRFFSQLRSPMANLTSLGLARNCIDESAAALLMRQIATLSALQYLDMSGNRLHVAGATALAACLPRLTMLTFLNVSENEICAAGASALSLGLPSLVHLCALNVAANDLRTEGMGHLLSPIIQLPYLAQMELGRNCIEDGGGRILAMHLSSLASLTRLGLGGSWGSVWHSWATTVGRHLTALTALRSLSLRCNGFQATHMAVLAPQLAQVTTLNSLDVSQNDMQDAGAIFLAVRITALVSLRALDISFNGIGGHGAQTLGLKLAALTGLEVLQAGGNGQAQVSPHAMQMMELPGDGACGYAALDFGAGLGSTLGELSGLRDLDLSCSGICSGTCKYIMNQIVRLTALTQLDMSGNAMDAEAVNAVYVRSMMCPALKAVHLGGNCDTLSHWDSTESTLESCSSWLRDISRMCEGE